MHLVINNQVGFTTAAGDRAHVVLRDRRGQDDPGADLPRERRRPRGLRARDAARLRLPRDVHTDVVVDLVCYRRYGHNEGDDPSYTQPLMYRVDRRQALGAQALHRGAHPPGRPHDRGGRAGARRLQREAPGSARRGARAAGAPVLDAVPAPTVPDGPATRRRDRRRRSDAARDRGRTTTPCPTGSRCTPSSSASSRPATTLVASGEVDWSLAEALAIGSLLLEGTDVRLVGQDTRRGTFSQRHAALIDYETGAQYVPLCHLDGATGRFTVRDSLLSEYAALGFEYGYSVERPDTLVAWEAQFGDFVNGAEIIIDNFLVAAEDKWGQLASLVLLLPHGYEGQGPEHSSGRIERFLSLCATQQHPRRRPVDRGAVLPPPALPGPPGATRRRSSASRRSRCCAPRRRARRSTRSTDGAFATVLDDDDDRATRRAVRSVVLASGKVAHEALGRAVTTTSPTGRSTRERSRSSRRAALPLARRRASPRCSQRYATARDVCWLQEEPENMGPWPFVHLQLHRDLRDTPTSATSRARSRRARRPGSALVHEAEQADLLARALAVTKRRTARRRRRLEPRHRGSRRRRASRQLDEAVRPSSRSTPTPRSSSSSTPPSSTASRRRARAVQAGRARRRDRHAAGRRDRTRRRVHLEDREARGRGRAVERLVPGVPRRAPVALRGGPAHRRQARAGRRLDLHRAEPGPGSQVEGGHEEGRSRGQGRPGRAPPPTPTRRPRRPLRPELARPRSAPRAAPSRSRPRRRPSARRRRPSRRRRRQRSAPRRSAPPAMAATKEPARAPSSRSRPAKATPAKAAAPRPGPSRRTRRGRSCASWPTTRSAGTVEGEVVQFTSHGAMVVGPRRAGRCTWSATRRSRASAHPRRRERATC